MWGIWQFEEGCFGQLGSGVVWIWSYLKTCGKNYINHLVSDWTLTLQAAVRGHRRTKQDLYHVFIDFKAVDRVWHAALWATMKKYNISTNLIQVIKNLYIEATSAVLFNSKIRDWFPTTAGVRQGCLLSTTLFNIFLERIMTDALEDHEGTVTIGGRTITNLRFADDIDGLAGEEEELANLPPPPPVSHRFSQCCLLPLKQFQCRSNWRWPFPVLSR